MAKKRQAGKFQEPRSGSVQPRKNHILAIAIDKYHNGQAPLQYPVQDCEQLIHLLTERYDFEERHIISRLYNEKATQATLYDELFYLRDKLNGDHNLLLIFSGHGHLDANGEGYWLPVDAPALERPSDVLKLISLDQILSILAKVKAHHIVLVVDSCFAGRFTQATVELPDLENADSNHPLEKPSRWVLSSGRLEPVDDDSPFSEAICAVLKENQETSLLLQELYLDIRRHMGPEAAQTADCAPIVPAELRGGEFAFRLREVVPQIVDLAAPSPDRRSALLQKLREGSQAYLDYLKQGRFNKLQFEKILLPEAHSAELRKETVEHGEVKMALREALAMLWPNDEPHTLICGEGGMGKTVSCVHLWEQLLRAEEGAPLPVFVPLNEYNAATDDEIRNQNYLYRFLAREYLDDAPLTPELEAELKDLFRNKNDQPDAIFLFDGFNEISVEKNHLMVELLDFVRRAPGAQIAITSRYEMRNFAWTQDFERLDLLPLTDAQIDDFLEQQSVALPHHPEVRELLRNPMMLTLYAGASQLAERFQDHPQLRFKPKVTSQGELLHNFIEAQLAKYLLDNEANPARDEEFRWELFLLHHLLPYLADRMVEEGQYFIYTRKVLAPAFNFKTVVQEAYRYFESFDFTDHYPVFAGHREELGFGLADNDYDALDERNCRIQEYLLRRLFLLAEEADTYRFLHQNFRDYFTAVHVQRTMEIALLRNRALPPEERRFDGPLHRAPLDYYVRQLLAELEGEYANFLEWNKEKGEWQWQEGAFFLPNQLWKLLEQCRGVFHQDHLGYTVWNILTIWKEQRGELSGADLRELDFQGFSFNDLRLSRPGLYADLSGGKLAAENLFAQGHAEPVNCAAFSPDGKYIVTGANDYAVKIWDAGSGQCLQTLEGHTNAVRSAVYSRDGRRLLTASYDRTARIWDTEQGTCLLVLDNHDDAVNSAAFSPDEQRIVTASFDKKARVWEVATGACLLTLEGHTNWVNTAAFSPDGRRIVTASWDYSARVWDAETGEGVFTLQGHTNWVNSAVFSPDGRHLLTASSDETARIWEAEHGQLLFTLEGHHNMVMSAVFSPDGRRVLTASADETARVWDVANGHFLLALEGHRNHIERATFSKDGRRIITASFDHTARLWDADTGQCLLVLEGHSHWVNSVTFSRDGRFLLTASSDYRARIWDTSTGRCLQTLDGHDEQVNTAAFSPDDRLIVTASHDHTARVWDARSGRRLLTLDEHALWINSAVFSPDGRQIATASGDHTCKVWDAISGECLLTLEDHSKWNNYLNEVAYSPDGRRLLTSENNQVTKVWDAHTGDFIFALEGHTDRVNSAAYDPAGEHIVTASDDHTVLLWESTGGPYLKLLEGHTRAVVSAAFSPDGRLIVTASDDHTARVWEVETGACLLVLEGHDARIQSAVFHPDGKQIATASWDHTVRIWDAGSGECLMIIPHLPGLLIQGCDLRELHPGSALTEAAIGLLRQYGGQL